MKNQVSKSYEGVSPIEKIILFFNDNPDVVDWGKQIILKGNKEEISNIVDKFGYELNDEQIYFASERVGDFVKVYIEKKGLFSERVGKMLSRGATSYVYDYLIEYFKK